MTSATGSTAPSCVPGARPTGPWGSSTAPTMSACTHRGRTRFLQHSRRRRSGARRRGHLLRHRRTLPGRGGVGVVEDPPDPCDHPGGVAARRAGATLGGPAPGPSPSTTVGPTGPGSVFYAGVAGFLLALLGAVIAAATASDNLVAGSAVAIAVRRGGGRADPPTHAPGPTGRHSRHRQRRRAHLGPARRAHRRDSPRDAALVGVETDSGRNHYWVRGITILAAGRARPGEAGRRRGRSGGRRRPCAGLSTAIAGPRWTRARGGRAVSPTTTRGHRHRAQCRGEQHHRAVGWISAGAAEAPDVSFPVRSVAPPPSPL